MMGQKTESLLSLLTFQRKRNLGKKKKQQHILILKLDLDLQKFLGDYNFQVCMKLQEINQE